MESATEDELSGLFKNCQNATSMETSLQEMGHPQPPTSVGNDNSAANSIVNWTAKYPELLT